MADLVSYRTGFSNELTDPRVKNALFGLTHAEVGGQGPQAQQAFLETVFNRAAARGKSLADTINDRAYFPAITHERAAKGAPANMTSVYSGLLDQVAGGSNVSNFATGNASGTVGFAGGPQTYAANGERFGVEGPDRKWAQQVGFSGQGMPAPTQQSTPTGAPAMAAPALTPYDGPSPDDVAMQRKLAMSLMQQGTSAEPVGHWTQALARVLQGGVGGMYQDQARQGERQGTQGLVDMLQGQQNPTPVQLLSNPWTREAGMKTLVQSAKGPEYGKQGTIVSDGKGNFYAAQFNDKGEVKYHKLEAGGQTPTGVMSSESGVQMGGAQPPSSTALQPAKGVKTVDTGTGTAILDNNTGATVRTIGKDIQGREAAEKRGQSQGQAQADLPKAQMSARTLRQYIKAVENDPNLDNVLGYAAYVPSIRPETKATEARVKQLQGRAFLMAFESLKGAGAITETEGAKATEALTRLTTLSQDSKAYREALKDFATEVDNLEQLAKARAMPTAPEPGNPASAFPNAPAASGWGIKPIGGQ